MYYFVCYVSSMFRVRFLNLAGSHVCLFTLQFDDGSNNAVIAGRG